MVEQSVCGMAVHVLCCTLAMVEPRVCMVFISAGCLSAVSAPSSPTAMLLTLLEPQTRFGDKLLRI